MVAKVGTAELEPTFELCLTPLTQVASILLDYKHSICSRAMVQNIEALYIGAATNRNPHAADIESTSSVVCFASKQLLGLWDVLVSIAIHHSLIS